MITLDFTGL